MDEVIITNDTIVVSYGDFRVTRYANIEGELRFDRSPFDTRSVKEFNGSRRFTRHNGTLNGTPIIFEADSFWPNFGHASNGGARILAITGEPIIS